MNFQCDYYVQISFEPFVDIDLVVVVRLSTWELALVINQRIVSNAESQAFMLDPVFYRVNYGFCDKKLTVRCNVFQFAFLKILTNEHCSVSKGNVYPYKVQKGSANGRTSGAKFIK